MSRGLSRRHVRRGHLCRQSWGLSPWTFNRQPRPEWAWPLAGNVRSGGRRRLPGVIVAHLDLDAFFAAVEELEQPELRSKPLVVGGDPHGRGVVATANYEARRYGIHSAMSSAEALRRCPQVVFVRPRHALYRQYSQEVWSLVREIVPRVERLGLDEGYLALDDVARDFHEARALAEAVQASVRARTRLSCSLGVATSKVVAKIASDRRKPGGIVVVRPGQEARFLGPVPDPAAARRRPARRGAAARASGSPRSATSPPSPTSSCRRCSRARSAASSATAPAGIDPRELELQTERISISHRGDLPARRRRPRAPARRAPADGRPPRRARSPRSSRSPAP